MSMLSGACPTPLSIRREVISRSARPAATMRRLAALTFVQSFLIPVMFLDILIVLLLPKDGYTA